MRLAQEQLKSDKEQAAIRAAVEAQQFADTAIGESRQRAGADAQMQASTAAVAQQDAAAANARAEAAERAATMFCVMEKSDPEQSRMARFFHLPNANPTR